MTKEEITKILVAHAAWLRNEEGGVRAYLSGAYLSGADLSDADLSGADLSDAYLRGADLRGADLRGADLRGADLRGAYLSGAYLSDADLSDADLSYADLSDADLSGADHDLTIPVVERLDARILESVEAAPESFYMGNWHIGSDGQEVPAGAGCGTAHCRAGWAIHLAGKPGYELEKRLGAQAAGTLIYQASEGYVPDFFTSNDSALADLRERAGKTNEETKP